MYRYLSLVLVSGSSWASIRLLGLGFGFMLGFYWVNRRLLGLGFGFRFGFGFGFS